MKAKFASLLLIMFFIGFWGCSTTSTTTGGSSSVVQQNQDYLKNAEKSASSKEIFRVLISSDSYTVIQLKKEKSILRVKDAMGDRYFIQELKKYDRINEVEEGVLKIGLFPDYLQRIIPAKRVEKEYTFRTKVLVHSFEVP